MLFTRTQLLRTVAVLALLLTTTVLMGQILTGSISGTVTDPSGAVVPNAKIKVSDPATGKEFAGTSSSNGEFVITGVPEGEYRVVVSATGFSNFVVNTVQVNLSQRAHVNAKLTVGAVGTEVSVIAEQAVVQTETAEVKFAIDRQQIQNLQLPTRNPLDIVRILPGMSTPSGLLGGDVIVHGLRANSTNITLDGINIADNYVKTSSFFGINAPVVDAVGEINVSTSGIGVDAGFGAAQVSMRTARGGNALHGSVYWFERNSFLNANTFFNKQTTPITDRPRQLQNRLGFSVGGPVFAPKLYNGKNKTFFFLSFEAYRSPAAQTQYRSVLTSDARSGLFTFVGQNDKIPHTINLLTGVTGAKVGNTGLPIQINTALMSIYNKFAPAPNGDSGCGSNADGYNIRCFLFNQSGSARQNRYAGRIDHNITDSHTVEFSYNQQNYFSWPDFLNTGSPTFPTVTGGGTGQESKRQLFTWALHSNFGTNKTNEVRFGLTRAPVFFALKEDYSPFSNQQIVLPLVSDVDYVQGNSPQGRNTPVRQITDNFAWVRGHHTIKLGGEWRHILAESIMHTYTQYPRLDIGTSQGVGFDETCGVSLSSGTSNCWGPIAGGKSNIDSTMIGRAQSLFALLTGMYSGTRQGYAKVSPTSGYVTGEPLKRDPTQFNLSFYAQDSWKMMPNFSLEYGVRWEYQGVYHERNGLALQPVDPVAGPWGAAGVGNYFNVLSTPAATDVMLQYVAGEGMRSLYKKQYTNFAPFMGFAWDPFRDGKTSIRAGAALHYTQDGFTVFNNAVSYADGLRITPQNTAPTGIYNPASVPWPAAPAESFSQKQNQKSNPAGIIVGVKPDLAVPYVIEWNFGIQREIGKRLTLEARYVGNHSVKQYRMSEVNQLNLYNNPFSSTAGSVANLLTEFKNAQANYALCNGQLTCGAAGVLPLPILSAILNPASATSTVRNYVRDGRVGNLFHYLRSTSPYYQKMIASPFPLNFFVPNPWVYNSMVMDNSSWSRYDAVEVELRRRFSSGLTFQINYTLSHGYTDQRFGSSQSEFQAFRDVTQPWLEKYRSPFDQRHVIGGQFIYPLPFGRGKWIGGGAPSWADKIIGGWQVQGMARIANGSPFTISSGRATTGTGNEVSETAILRNMTVKDLARYIGTFKTPDKGVYWLNPASGLIKFTTSSTGVVSSSPLFCVAGQTSPCWDYPKAGEMGNTSYYQWTGPLFWSQDFSLSKKIPITSISEQFNFEVRVEMYNAFNHATFSNPAPSLAADTSKFGQLNSLADTSRGGGVNSRNMAFQLRVNF